MASPSDFGRPGRKADLARELHQAFADRGIELLPGRARQMLDERVAAVAEQMRISEKAALSYLPTDWPEQTAADVAVEREQAQMAEQMATGTVTISAARLSALMAGLAVAIQNSVWRVMDGSLPAAVGEPLDCLTGLALKVESVPADLEVGRAELLAVARHLGSEADVLRAGGSSPDRDNPAQRERVVDRLVGDAEAARRLAR